MLQYSSLLSSAENIKEALQHPLQGGEHRDIEWLQQIGRDGRKRQAERRHIALR
jgi:hypothetical protein